MTSEQDHGLTFFDVETFGPYLNDNSAWDPKVLTNAKLLVTEYPAPSNLDEMILKHVMRKEPSLKELSKLLFPSLVQIQHDGDLVDTSSKEIPSMTVKLRIPTETVERRDITAALEALGQGDADYILNMIAHVQDLDTGERIVRADKLTRDQLGRHITVIDGDAMGSEGFMTDLINCVDRDGTIQMVLDGTIIKASYRNYIIVGGEFDASSLDSMVQTPHAAGMHLADES